MRQKKVTFPNVQIRMIMLNRLELKFISELWVDSVLKYTINMNV